MMFHLPVSLIAHSVLRWAIHEPSEDFLHPSGVAKASDARDSKTWGMAETKDVSILCFSQSQSLLAPVVMDDAVEGAGRQRWGSAGRVWGGERRTPCAEGKEGVG